MSKGCGERGSPRLNKISVLLVRACSQVCADSQYPQEALPGDAPCIAKEGAERFLVLFVAKQKVHILLFHSCKKVWHLCTSPDSRANNIYNSLYQGTRET